MRTIDLFAGCGGLSLGFQEAGFNLVGAFDNWMPAIKVYRQNFSHPIFELDLSNNLEADIFTKYHPEIIIGSPPCQDFSSAGKRTVSDLNFIIDIPEVIKDEEFLVFMNQVRQFEV